MLAPIAMAAPLRRATGRPVCCTLQGEELFLDGLIEPYRSRAIALIKQQVPDVDRFVAVSDELARAIRENGIRVDRTIHNAIRTQDALPSAEAVADFRRRFGLAGKQVVTIAGRLHEQKGVLQLLRVLARLAPDHPDLRVLAMGRTEAWEVEFAPAARSLGVAERVVTTGWLEGEDLQAAYAATDVFVTPSICFDTFGLVNLEAMEHRKPVVATSFGGSPEVVRTGETGLVVNPFDVEGLAGAISSLLRDEDLRRRMGEAGYLRLSKLFTIERLTSEYLEEYARASSAALAVRSGAAIGR